MKRSNKKGFTIVELVIVIAIIAILAAVLIPTFASLIQKANEANARAEAKNLITEMLADILTGEDGEADLLVFSNKGNDVYVYGYSREAGRVIAYCENPKAIPSGKSFEDYVNADDGLIAELKTKKVITEVADLAADDWRQPDKTKEIVNQLDSKGGGMLLFANYTIKLDAFQYANALTVNGKGYDNFSEAVLAAKDGGTITLSRNEAFKFTATEATTLKNITFKAADGITVKGLQLVATKGNKLPLENITFDGMSFTDKVVLGQEGGYRVHSACSNITFENCTFDLSESTEAKDKKFAISRTLAGTSIDCFTDLTVKNCSFKNADRAIAMTTDLSGITVENCKFENLASYAVSIMNASGDIKIKNNTANNTNGVLQIGTVGNTFATSGDANSVIIIDNVAENMACDNKKVFWAGNGSSNIESVTFTVTGNRCTYTNGSTYVGFYIEHADGSVKGAEKSIEQQ